MQTEESARYDSRGNGPAEAGAKAVKDKVRTLISATNASCGIKLDGYHVLMPYLVRSRWCFVSFPRQQSLLPAWRNDGIFVGMRDNSDEVYILIERGIFVARSMKRPGPLDEVYSRCT